MESGFGEHQLNEIAPKVMSELFRVFIIPELQRRYAAGTLDPRYVSDASTQPVTFIFPCVMLAILEDGRPTQVLFDEETNVETLAEMQLDDLNRELRFNDLKLRGYRIKQLPPNAGYVVLINQEGRKWADFDFRRNGQFARQHLRQAQGFISAARSQAEARNSRVAVENLFHAVEKLCKAELLLLPLGLRQKDVDDVLGRRQHGEIRDLYESVGQDARGLELLRRVAELRPAATYHTKKHRLSKKGLQQLVAEVDAFRLRVQRRVPNAKAARPDKRFPPESLA